MDCDMSHGRPNILEYVLSKNLCMNCSERILLQRISCSMTNVMVVVYVCHSEAVCTVVGRPGERRQD